MQYRHLSIILALTSVLALSACGTKTLTLSSFDGAENVNVMVEIADSPKERQKGLMNRTELDSDSGMLFVFTQPEMLSFWMKDTKIPLEVIYFDTEGEFVSALSMEPCAAMPCPGYSAASLSSYALEVNKGFREKYHVGSGWKIDVKQVQKMSKPT